MQSKKYRLQKVLEVRNLAKNESARLVAHRLQQVEEAENELSRLQKKLQACLKRQNQAKTLMNAELNKGLLAHKITQHRNFLDDLKKREIEIKSEVEKQRKVVKKVEKELETARSKLVETTREMKVIETHKSNWQTSENSKNNRREQKISDEIGTILHRRRKSS